MFVTAPTHGAEVQLASVVEIPVRLKRPFTVSYHSHWVLLGGVRASYRLFDAKNELNAFYGNAIVSGCGPQAPRCAQEPAINLGVRRYFSDSSFTGYVGTNLHWMFGGMRFYGDATPMLDASLGFNHQTDGHFNWGLGYSVFIFDEESEGLSIGYNGWILSELGYTF